MKDPIHSKFVIQMISYTLDMDPKTIAPKKRAKPHTKCWPRCLPAKKKEARCPRVP